MTAVVKCHVEDTLPADVTALIEISPNGERVDVFVSRAHSLEVVSRDLFALGLAAHKQIREAAADELESITS